MKMKFILLMMLYAPLLFWSCEHIIQDQKNNPTEHFEMEENPDEVEPKGEVEPAGEVEPREGVEPNPMGYLYNIK